MRRDLQYCVNDLRADRFRNRRKAAHTSGGEMLWRGVSVRTKRRHKSSSIWHERDILLVFQYVCRTQRLGGVMWITTVSSGV